MREFRAYSIENEVKNMEVFTVSLFGHREINDIWGVREQIARLIKPLIQEETYVTFLVGRNGEFDECAAAAIKRVQAEIGNENSEMTLVLPYQVADMESYEKYYDSIIIPEAVYGVHPKSAITRKNRWMVECSDLVIVYVGREEGGAYKAMRYAEKLKKRIVNLKDLSSTDR